MADGSLIFDTKVDESGFEKGLNRLKSIGGTALEVVGKATVAVGTAVSALGGYALKASIDFESAFAGVRKTVDATEQEFGMLENGIRELSKKMPQSASEIATVAEAAGQLGIQTENILGFTETMVMLGDATNMSSDQAATALARLANITGMSQADFDRLGSTIVALGNNLATTESEIVEMGLRLAGTASQVGMTEDQILALAAAMSSVGINAEAGGSSMSRVIQKINTEVLSAGKNLNQFAKIAGMSAEEFSKVWREKPQEAILAFVRGLDEINKSGGDVTSTLKELGINSIQEIDTLLRLAGANETLADALGISAEAWEENIALQKEAEQRYQTTESLIKILKNNIDDLAISVGDELKESMRDGIGTAIEMVEQLADALETRGLAGLVEELGTVLADIATQAAEFAPTLLEVGANMIMSFISGIQENLPSIVKAALSITQTLITSILEVLPQLVQLGAELLVALITGIAEMLPSLMTQIIDTVTLVADTIIQNLPLIIDAGLQLIMALVEGIINNLPTIIQAGVQTVLSIIDGISQSLPQLLEAAKEIITKITEGLINNIDLLLDGAIKIVEALIEFIVQNLPLLTEAALEIITALIDYLIDNLPMLVDSAVKLVMAIVEGLINNVELLVDAALQLIIGIVQGLLNNLPLLIEAAIQLIYAIIDGLLQMIPELVATGIQLVSVLIGAILSMIPQIISTGMQLVGELVIGILRAAPRLLTAGVILVETVIEGIKSVFSGIVEVGKDLVRGLWDGIISLKDWILKKVRDFAGSIISEIKKVFGIRSPSAIMRDEIGENLTLGISVGFEKGMPELQKDIEKELSGLLERMKTTVEFEAASIGTKLSAGSGVIKATQNVINNDNGITQNININQPVQSPSEIARQIKRVGRELALGY